MIDSESNSGDGSTAMRFAGAALAVTAAVALFLYADGYFDSPDGLEMALPVPQSQTQPG